MLFRSVVAGFLFAHGLIHASFLAARPPATAGGPSWPFELDRSWLLSPLGMRADTTRGLGMALTAATIAGFALAALVALGILPASLWAVGIGVGAVSSLALLGLFYRPWLTLGVAIDLVLLWAAFIASWMPDGLES